MLAVRYSIFVLKRDIVLLNRGLMGKNGSRRLYNNRIKQKVIDYPQYNTNKQKGITPTSLLFLLVPVSTFWLGCWQIKRKKWKEDLIENYKRQSSELPIPLPDEDSEILQLEYRKVYVRGTFDHAGEMYLGPRSLLAHGKSSYQGKLMSTEANKSSGFLVITPFILSETKDKILVNRGWVSFPHKNPKTRLAGQIEEEIELEGTVRLTEPKPSIGPANKLDTRIWFHRNVEEMAAFANCRPVYLDASVDSTVNGGPIGGQTRADFRNEHLQYIITWFGISIGTGYVWWKMFLK